MLYFFSPVMAETFFLQMLLITHSAFTFFLCKCVCVCPSSKHVVMMRPDLLPCPCWLRTRQLHSPSLPPISLIISYSLGRRRSKPASVSVSVYMCVFVWRAELRGLPLAPVCLVNGSRSQWYF